MGALPREVLQLITSDPTRFAAEAVQSALLLVILGWSMRRYAGRRLAERRARIAAQLEQAQEDVKESARLRAEAVAVVENAKASAAEISRAGKAKAADENETQQAAIASEAQRLIAQARETVATEQEKIRHNASERLLRLTTEISRRYVEEMLTESERRSLVHKAIEAFVEDLQREPVRSGTGGT